MRFNSFVAEEEMIIKNTFLIKLEMNCRNGMIENEYLHNARDVFDRFQIYLHQKYSISEEDVF